MLKVLKEAQYTYKGSAESSKVVYVISGFCCYFSGIDHNGVGTINAAEEVVTAIAQQEDVPMGVLRFFDLQTHRGYPQSKESGDYVFEELKIERADGGGFRCTGWVPATCPPHVLPLFLEFIWE